MSRPLQYRLFAVVATCIFLLTACSTPAKGKESNSLNKQGLRALAVLTQYLFPPEWNESLGVSVARRMFPLEYHGNASGGKTLIQSKIEFDTGALHRLLTDVRQLTPSFTAGTDLEQTFGKNSNKTVDDSGAVRQLSWWKPGDHKERAYYFWRNERPGQPPSRIWLQASDGKKGTKTVYVRIEAEQAPTEGR